MHLMTELIQSELEARRYVSKSYEVEFGGLGKFDAIHINGSVVVDILVLDDKIILCSYPDNTSIKFSDRKYAIADPNFKPEKWLKRVLKRWPKCDT